MVAVPQAPGRDHPQQQFAAPPNAYGVQYPHAPLLRLHLTAPACRLSHRLARLSSIT
ncbi:hypothetical protein B0H10DRAFT_2021901 [Mycena sp. CBHHK59/15]|nr:hypothetical protein B0H10DRAFT_2021901 [Mycena sp. CBHHK59/15]